MTGTRFDRYRDLWSQLVRLGGRLTQILAGQRRRDRSHDAADYRQVEAEYAATLARIRDVQAGRASR